MKKLIVTMGLLSALCAIPTMAQITNGITFDAPSAFYAGNAKMPAGHYRVTQPDADNNILLIEDSDRSHSVFVEYEVVSSDTPHTQSDVTFNKYGKAEFLSTVWIEGRQSEMHMLPSKIEQRAAKAATAEKHTLSAMFSAVTAVSWSQQMKSHYVKESDLIHRGGISVKTKLAKWERTVLLAASSALLLNALAFGAANNTRQLAAGEKVKVTGTILSRDGELIRVRDKRSGEVVVVNINDNTKIKREEHRVLFSRHNDMDVTAMLPGLTVRAEGIGNSKGQLDATTIAFTPDAFSVEVAQEQQVLANKAAAQEAQSTAHQGVTAANMAQASAAEAQGSADQASMVAQAAGDLAVSDAGAAAMLNQRMSELDDYKNEFEVDVFFARDSAVLDKTAVRDLANLADIAKSLNGYMIEIAGYSSNTLSPEVDQKLSEERAAAVAKYFLEVKGIPMRRILVPVGYGRKQPVASNSDPKGRELNRRVDVKILVNKGLQQGL